MTQFQIFNVPPQGGSFVYPPLAAICLKSRHSSTRFCTGLHNRYPIVSSLGQQLGGATCRLSCCLTLSFVPTPLSDTWILGFLNTWILGYLDTGILDTLGTRLQPPPGQRPATSLTTTALATTVKIRYYREDTKHPMIPDESAS